MPQLSELQQAASKESYTVRAGQKFDGGESFVVDARSMQRPMGMVEEKLSRLTAMGLSCLQVAKPR